MKRRIVMELRLPASLMAGFDHAEAPGLMPSRQRQKQPDAMGTTLTINDALLRQLSQRALDS